MKEFDMKKCENCVTEEDCNNVSEYLKDKVHTALVRIDDLSNKVEELNNRLKGIETYLLLIEEKLENHNKRINKNRDSFEHLEQSQKEITYLVYTLTVITFIIAFITIYNILKS